METKAVTGEVSIRLSMEATAMTIGLDVSTKEDLRACATREAHTALPKTLRPETSEPEPPLRAALATFGEFI